MSNRNSYTNWNETLGNNFNNQNFNNGTQNPYQNNQNTYQNNHNLSSNAMLNKNIETGGKYQATVSGMYGEFTVAAVMKSLPSQYHVLNDIILDTGTKLEKYQPQIYGVDNFKHITRNGKVYSVIHQTTQLDHIIVSNYGIFVIETKNHKGFIFGDLNGAVWTQTFRGAGHFTFYNPVQQNEGHLRNLSKQTGIKRNFMTGMIVFTNPEANLENVKCPFCYTVDQLYNAILSFNKPIWNNKQVVRVIQAIEKLNSNSYFKAKQHEEYVQHLKHVHDINKMRKRGF